MSAASDRYMDDLPQVTQQVVDSNRGMDLDVLPLLQAYNSS